MHWAFWASQQVFLAHTTDTKEMHQSLEYVVAIARGIAKLTYGQGDAYLHDGEVDYFELDRWEHLYSMLGEEDKYASTIHKWAKIRLLIQHSYTA